MEEAGCYEKFIEYGREIYYTIYQAWTAQGEKVFSWSVGEDQPELDREQIKKGKVELRKKVVKSMRDGEVNVVLRLEDGTMENGSGLVVGADGVHIYLTLESMVIRMSIGSGKLCIKWDTPKNGMHKGRNVD
ncbi:hypothetical protein DL98DRAFT_593666 [Cadophora sp. DSE1049]|nr:hypothetical protein DL98DRAFT_593666 [Cadophora sp. DSE1049]